MSWLNGRSGPIALLLSVALNLIVVTAVGVHFFARDGHFRDHRTGWRDTQQGQQAAQASRASFGISRLAGRMDEADGKALKDAFAAKEADVKAIREGYREARRKVRDALKADSYDGGAVSAAMLALAAQRNRLQDTLQGVIATAATTMSVEGRTKLANRGNRRGRRRR
jgi:uncharacterized membrane protein